MTIAFNNSYINLPEQCYRQQAPTPVATPGLIRVNQQLCAQLNIDPTWLSSEAGVSVAAGNTIAEGSQPIATVYAGHQFGNWNPQLGDGRAVLLGEVLDQNNNRFDVQLKGSGPTPYSRGGDGRAPLGPVLREYIVSEAMAALGVPTSRSLAAVTSGERVYREQDLPGAVLTRVAQSHIRIGTLQYFAAQQDLPALEALVAHIIQRHYPQAQQSENSTLAMFELILAKQASLVAHWQSLGFIHGVMNTDNILLCGETIDYGPCAFMDTFNPDQVFSSIDRNGRYAYSNQPGIMQWNLSALAQALVPLLAPKQDQAVELARSALDKFPALFSQAYMQQMLKKIGISDIKDGDDVLLQDLLTLMAQHNCDFTHCFRFLISRNSNPDNGIPGDFSLSTGFDPWLDRWQQRRLIDKQSTEQQQALMCQANPVFIPRNHIIEAAIDSASQQQDFSLFNKMVDALATPYTYNPDYANFALAPKQDQIVKQTFCGT